MKHRLIALKPMRAGASGYARLQAEGARTLLLVSVHGLKVAGVRAFWYFGGGEARLLGEVRVNPRGEASLSAELPVTTAAPERLQALLLMSVDARPAPLMIGLCVEQSAGSLLDAKNALLALCDRCGREAARAAAADARGDASADAKPSTQAQSADGSSAYESSADESSADMRSAARSSRSPNTSLSADESPQAPTWYAADESSRASASCSLASEAAPSTSSAKPKRSKQKSPAFLRSAAKPDVSSIFPPEPPREIFLPAIDPAPYQPASEPPARAENPVLSSQSAERKAALPPAQSAEKRDEIPEAPPRASKPVDALPALRWPESFASLAPYFEQGMPTGAVGLSGFRFVHVPTADGEGVFIGRCAVDGWVRRVAYAWPAEHAPEEAQPCRLVRGADGRDYRLLIQKG